MKNILQFLCCLILMTFGNSTKAQEKPLKLAISGLSHGHSHWIFNRENKNDVQLVGIYEPNIELQQKFREQYNLTDKIFYTDLNEMLEAVKPEAVAAFGSVFHHLETVKAAAPRGIHIMVEKPLAVNTKYAREMASLARKHKVQLLTNYETSWYPTTKKTLMMKEEGDLNKISKMVFHHGHQGPKEIGVSEEFLDWLTDPKLNGGGALVDFGCYGANIATSLMKGQRPKSVTAVSRNYKPKIYSEVEDDATILVNYENSQAIIQASWHWPFNRKDMEVYAENNTIITGNDVEMEIQSKNNDIEKLKVSAKETGVITDPFTYLAKVIRGQIEVPEFGLYSLENNLLVVEILEAAKESVKSGKTVKFK